MNMIRHVIINLILITSAGLPLLGAADVMTVDPAGVVIVAGAVPTAPSAGEIRLGAGQVNAYGAINAGDVTINRTTPATSAQAVRGDDRRLSDAGGVAQRQWFTFTPILSTTSTTFVSSTLSATLPSALKSTSSKVLIRVTGVASNTGTQRVVFFTIYRGSTPLHPAATTAMHACLISDNNIANGFTFECLDAPSSVTPETYTLYWRTNNSTAYLGQNGIGEKFPLTIYLEEIK